jgi:hypothetical protein
MERDADGGGKLVFNFQIPVFNFQFSNSNFQFSIFKSEAHPRQLNVVLDEAAGVAKLGAIPIPDPLIPNS